MAVWQPTQLNLFQKGCCLKEAWSEPLGGGGLERAILACSHMNSMDTAISRRYEENKQSYLISDLFLIISFPFNLYFNSYLQFRTNLTMYLLALMIYLVTIVSAKKKARMIFFRHKHEFTKFYKILTILHLKQNDFALLIVTLRVMQSKLNIFFCYPF